MSKSPSLIGALVSAASIKTLSPVDNRGGWMSVIKEPFTGAWQRNMEIRQDTLREFFAIYACITLIAGDIAKMRPLLKKLDSNGIWNDFSSPAFSPVLKRPNRYQNIIQFVQWWMTSKLGTGNTYALKQRDNRGVVVALYILDPCRVQVLIAEDGSVYYELAQDDLNGLGAAITVPASEIIHDRYSPQFHPLVGITPILAAALSGGLGMRIQQESRRFFENGAKPGGILSAPGAISDETASRLKQHWDANYTGENAGKVAVVGDGLKFEAMRSSSVDSQLVEQLKLASDITCSAFHVPPFKIGMGTLPNGKVQDMNLIYYTDCLQVLVEEFEICMDEGLALPSDVGVEMNLEALLRMDTATQYTTLGEGIKSAVLSPNEARKKVNQPPKEGGDSVFLQQQNYSLAALAKRDAQADPFSTSGTTPAPAAQPAAEEDTEPTEEEIQDQARAFSAFIQKELASADYA